ncbi:MAG: hypothetical protein CVU90_08220 [Firmicutes bacterium HGW-Firmicutes-15]|nr:MAG: hypothetical protein CVU90_08220 [Firmicutes bacterium HGW-Firmicutes-15]
MMKVKLQKFAMNALAVALVFIGGTGASLNCWFITYEPDIPESLKR